MQRLILHIGHPKTGTTTLQKTLQASRSALSNAGILHPNTGQHHNPKVIIPYLTGGKSTFSDLSSIERSHEKWDAVLREIKTSKPNTIIISSEQLFRGIKGDALKSLVAHLKSLGGEINIVAYLREPASFAMSSFQQRLKQRPNLELKAADYYRNVLEPFLTCGAGPVNVRLFDRSTLEGGDLVKDFFTHYISDFDQRRLSRCKDTNTSMSAEAMALMQEINRKERSWASVTTFQEIIRSLDAKLEGYSRPRMHDHIRNAIQARCTDLDWLEDNFGLRFPRIDTTAMNRSEANQLCDNIDRVEDICSVDADRKELLWRSAYKANTPLRRWLRENLKIG